MIKRGKYFSPPPKENLDFKDLIQRAVSLGIGRAVGRDGFPPGPWTPELLADAIAQFDAKGGVDVRTVQNWLQDGDKGVSSQNIRWLARVFGCDDPIATSEWQTELSAAQTRLISRRREKRKAVGVDATVTLNGMTEAAGNRRGLAQRVEGMFLRYGPLNLPIIVWSACAALWFLAYVTGVHSITYSPLNGLSKQVGFFWSVSWTIGEMLAIPVYLIAVSELLSFWKHRGRPLMMEMSGQEVDGDGWRGVMSATSASHWAILVVCALLIFLLQWLGVYLRQLLAGSTDIAMVDWILVAVFRPEVISLSEATSISLLAFIYSGAIYWFFFSGMLLIYTIAKDFADIYGIANLTKSQQSDRILNRIGTTVLVGLYCCTVLGAYVAICLKLNATYLVSDGSYLTRWLVEDALFALGIGDVRWDWISGSPSPFFTSFLLLLISISVFVLGSAKMLISMRGRRDRKAQEKLRIVWLWQRMVGILTLLCLSYALIGAFVGFSIVLAISVVASLASLWLVSKLVAEGEEPSFEQAV